MRSRSPLAPRVVPRDAAVALAAYRAERDAARRVIDAAPGAVSGAFRKDLIAHEVEVERARARFVRGVSTLAELISAVAAARARFATITGGGVS